MFRRHDLLVTSQKNIPGIVKRQEVRQEGWIEVGYSYPYRIKGQRVRESSKVEIKNIEKIISPYEILQLYRDSDLKRESIDELINLSKKYSIEIGIFGSLALDIFTKMNYYEINSDIDIILKEDSQQNENLFQFYEEIKKLENKLNRKIDIELEIGDGFSCKLEEYLRGQKTILGKGLYEAKLIYQK